MNMLHGELLCILLLTRRNVLKAVTQLPDSVWHTANKIILNLNYFEEPRQKFGQKVSREV
jgi:hypothetical protein